MTTATLETRTARIRALNDQVRCASDPIGALIVNGSLVVTSGIAMRGNDFVDACVAAVRRFSDFTPENDPHGEHDMAFLAVRGTDIFFKVDYYDRNLKWHSPDATDAALTRRILTVGLAEEY